MIKICNDIIYGCRELTIYRQLKNGVLATYRPTPKQKLQKPVIKYWKGEKLENFKTQVINITEEEFDDCPF